MMREVVRRRKREEGEAAAAAEGSVVTRRRSKCYWPASSWERASALLYFSGSVNWLTATSGKHKER